MTDSLVHCGLYDPDRSTDTLLADTVEAARRAGLGPAVGASVVAVPHPGAGGLVDVRIEYSDLAPALRGPSTAMGSRLAEVIDRRPARHRRRQPGVGAGRAAAADLAAGPRAARRRVGTGGDPRPGTAGGLRGAASPALGPPSRRRPHLGRGRMWSLSDGILRGDGEDLTAAVFEAWTGYAGQPPDALAGPSG